MNMNNKLVKEILGRVDLRLAELDIPKEKFYKESGISSASFSQWSRGVHQPTAKKLQIMADYLGINVEYLITGEGEKEKTTTGASGGDRNAVISEILEIVKSLDIEGQKDVLEMAKILTKRNDK